MADLALGELSGDQTEKVLQFQVHFLSSLLIFKLTRVDVYPRTYISLRDNNDRFQDLTGIEDLSICRDVLQRHNWNLEVAVQVRRIISSIRFYMYNFQYLLS